MPTQTLNLRIDPSQQGQYLRIPFQVAPDMAMLRIAYSYERHRLVQTGPLTRRDEVNIIDLALEDSDQALVGTSGSERRAIEVAQDWATPGYRGIKLAPGQWHLVLGACRVAPQGCPVEVTLEQVPKAPVLLRGDTHTHTNHSDGWYTVEEVIARAKQDRLDYLFITDHNSMTSNAQLHADEAITVIPGAEITYYGGHYNLYGVKRPVKNFVANTREAVLAIMGEGRSNGALLSINHPVDNPCAWQFGFGPDVPCDMLEVWNGPFAPHNVGALKLWHQALCQGRRLPAIGGSDNHHTGLFFVVGTPTTFLYAASRGSSDILAAMKAGHAFIGMGPEAPRLSLSLGDAMMGDVAQRQLGQALHCTLEALDQGDEVRLVGETGVIFAETPGRAYQMTYSWKVPEGKFVRLEIWRSIPGLGQTLASLSNPLYLVD